MSKPSDDLWRPWLNPDETVDDYLDDPADDLFRIMPDRIRLKRGDLNRTIIALEYARRCTLKEISSLAGLFDRGPQTELAQLLLALQIELARSLMGARSDVFLPGPHEATNPRANDPELWTLRFEALGAVAYLGKIIGAGKSERFVCKLLKSEGIAASRSSLSEWRQELRRVRREELAMSADAGHEMCPIDDDKHLANSMRLVEKLAFNESGEWRLLDFDAFLPIELAKRAFPFMAYRDPDRRPNEPMWDRSLPERWSMLDDSSVSEEQASGAVKELTSLVLVPIARRIVASR